MFENSKVIWSEGMFLRPQHFQQHDRYLENLINGRCMGLRPYGWGFFTLTLDTEILNIGKLALKGCQGIFPDGTPFSLPEDGELPSPLDVPDDVSEEFVFLCLPLRRHAAMEIDSDTKPDGLARLRMREREVRDNTNDNREPAPVQIGNLKTRLICQREVRSGYTCLGVAKVVEVRADKTVKIDDTYICPSLNCFAVSGLRAFLIDLLGKINRRGEAIASRLSDPDHHGLAGFRKFYLLQIVNRYQALFEHLSNVVGLHPEEFYRYGVQLTGELSTFYRAEKRPAALPVYNHEDLRSTFLPLMKELAKLLGQEEEETAIPLPIRGPKFGNIYAAQMPDPSLLDQAAFILAAKADVPSDALRSELPGQIIVSPVEWIHKRVQMLSSGIAIHPMQVVPNQIPVHAGFTYFELDKRHEDWQKMKTSKGFAFHVNREFPGLKLEFWAVKTV